MIKIKLFLIISILTITIIFPIGDANSIKSTLFVSIILIIFGAVYVEIHRTFSLLNKLTYEKPKWTDRLNLRKPLTYLHLIAYLLVASGLGSIIGGLYIGQIVNYIGIILLSFGIGQVIGIYLICWRITKNKINVC